ncbi:MAG: hypothetical protein V9E94_15555 [Microthrixaceae bacterium]
MSSTNTGSAPVVTTTGPNRTFPASSPQAANVGTAPAGRSAAAAARTAASSPNWSVEPFCRSDRCHRRRRRDWTLGDRHVAGAKLLGRRRQPRRIQLRPRHRETSPHPLQREPK